MAIVPAWLHADALKSIHARLILEPRYQYFALGSWAQQLDVKADEWNVIQRASVRSREDAAPTLLGLLSAQVDRDVYAVNEIGAFSFLSGPHPVWARDMAGFFAHLILARGFQRVGWSVVVGNPAEAMYDKLIARVGGRVVGVTWREIRLRTGALANRKLYEVIPDEIPEEGRALLERLAR